MVVNSSTEKNIEFYEKLGHFWMQKTIISKINSRSEKLTEFVDIVLSELRYSKKFFSRAKAREKDIVDIEITKRKIMNLTKQADLLESMIEEAEAKNDDMKMAMLQDEQEMSEREIRDMQVFLESRMNMMKKIEESGRERLEMIQKIIVIKDNISQIVQESGLSRFNKKVLDIDVILTENGFYTIGKNKILSEVELVQIKEMNNQIGQMQNYVEEIRKKLMKKEEAQVLQQQLTRENKAPNLSDGSNRFEINEIKSSLSLILSDLEEGNTSDDLRRLGLYYSNKFLQLPNGEYSKITKKLIVVNSIEKFLKYSVNTFYDRENTNIILHDSTSEDFKPFWKDRRSVGMVFRPTTNPSADIFIIDCDGEILPRHIKKYLNIYRKEGTAREGHLLFIDINNTYTSGRVRTTNHPFNKWLKNLDRRTKTREQSQSAGLPDIIEIRYQNKNSIHQPSKKANDLLPKNIKEFNRKIRSNWKEVVDYTQKSKVKFNCINPEIVNFWLSVDIGGTIVTEERIFGLKQLDTSIEKGNFDEALSNVEDIISMTKTKLEEFDISYQLKIILQYLLNGYINSPESLTMKYNINEIYKSLSMEYTPKTGFPYLQESLQSDFHRFAACLPNINLTKCMLTLKNKEDFSEITLLSEAGRDINKIWSRPTAGSYGYYSQGNIFDIVFSPLVKLKIPQYNFEFVGNKIVSDYESKMRHLKEIKNFSYDDDESNFWSRIGMGWTILINENRINDLFDLMDLCDSRDSSILFSLLMDQAISDPKIEVKKHLRQMEYLIDEYVLSMLENDKKINKLIYLKNLGLTDKTKRKIIKEIKSYDFETN
ncbi:MAG: hypothetical protein HOJ35_12125, partial [Bdellovibrionales bacterium]|nr:hypothetical protein [Bdellovibrionales bacterium]